MVHVHTFSIAMLVITRGQLYCQTLSHYPSTFTLVEYFVVLVESSSLLLSQKLHPKLCAWGSYSAYHQRVQGSHGLSVMIRRGKMSQLCFVFFVRIRSSSLAHRRSQYEGLICDDTDSDVGSLSVQSISITLCKTLQDHVWLVVSTPLKNISQLR